MTSLLTRNRVPFAVALFVTCMLLVWLVSSPDDTTLSTCAAVSGVLAALGAVGSSTWTSRDAVVAVRLAPRDRRRHA